MSASQTFSRKARLREQYAAGLQREALSERVACRAVNGDLSEPILRVSDGNKVFEFNVTAALLWVLTSTSSDNDSYKLRVKSAYPELGSYLVRDADAFIANCIRDGIIIFDHG